GRSQLDAFDVAACEFQVAILAVRNDQRRLREAQLVERFSKLARLVRFKLPGIHDGQLLVRKLRRESRTQCAEQNLLGKRVAVVTRTRSVNRAAMAPQRRPDRTDSSAARALLLPELAACAAHFALFFHFVRAAAERVQIPTRGLVQKMLINL